MVNGNPHLLRAIAEYRQAMEMRRKGLIGNVSMQREYLRPVYRLVAGKSA